ncbi:MAG: type II toxin-antitoxin system HicB family antitoxin [Candidatus Limnocylindria bacterium]|nr:type II toxin-antitoxin system HicB family antitoxin [Candidatus Limnocylindria bacterium]
MIAYALYLESGPQKKTTMVHVLDLLGCVATGSTTDEALERTPDAIRAYLGYLKPHGERADPKAAFTTRVVEHITEGDFLGHGSSTVMYTPDRVPLTPSAQRRYIAWSEWSRGDLLAAVNGLDAKALRAKPRERGRSVEEILRHVLESDKDYLYSFLGPVKAVGGPVNDALRGELDLRVALALSGAAAVTRLRALTAEERRASRQRGKATRTARRMFRRMLEHEWEHRVELAQRLRRPA